MILIIAFIFIFGINISNPIGCNTYDYNIILGENGYKEKYINSSVKDLAKKYATFSELLKDAHVELPVSGNMIPQGITYMKQKVLITAYDDKKERNSVCYVLDNDGFVINTVNLNMKSHVGSIAYDEIHNLIWLPDENGILNAYNSMDFIFRDSVKPLLFFDNVSNGLKYFKNKKQIAFLCVKENHIFIGDFSKTKNGKVKEYKINKSSGVISLEYIKTFTVPARTQSIEFYKKDNKEYILISSSYGRRNKSYIYFFEFDENKMEYLDSEIKKVCLPPLLEQITVKSDELYLIFESGAKKYKNCKERINYICILDLAKM